MSKHEQALTLKSPSKAISTASKLPRARCASLRGYRQLVALYGGDSDALLAAAGLGGVPIEEENLLIPSHTLYNALELASSELNQPDFGLQLAQYQDFDILGQLSLMIKDTDSLPQLLQLLSKHFHTLHNHGARISYSISGTDLCLQYVQAVPQALRLSQSINLAFGFVALMSQKIVQPSIKAKAVYFKCDAPKDISLFKKIFQTPVYFNQTFDGAMVNIETLQQSYKIIDVETPSATSLSLETISNTANAITLSQQVSLLISEQIIYENIDLKHYAKLLQMSERTLQRRLKLEQTSFKEILDRVRKDMAVRYLQRNTLNMAQISEVLCFSDQAAFTRAFRRWYQTTPITYKQSL